MSGDVISRQAVEDALYEFSENNDANYNLIITEYIDTIPSVNPQESKMEEFAKWAATEIFDDNWEYNKDAFEELACRKLAELGIVRANGDEWELIEPQESEDKE